MVRLAGALGFHTARRTPERALRELMRSLYPVDPGVPLVRIGPQRDGGYLVPDDLEGIRYVFSPGVSSESGFEAELADRGMTVFLADHSVDGPASSHPRFVFDKRFIGSAADDRYMTLDEWHAEKLCDEPDAELLLQMDIEGGELEALLAASPALMLKFRIMVIEIHELPQLWNEPFFQITSRFFHKLLATHTVVHIHPNNCRKLAKSGNLAMPIHAEFTWLRNDRVRGARYRTDFPHPLDRPNVSKAPVDLPRCWYAAED